jgi:sugar phosphate isomerase/epimerase
MNQNMSTSISGPNDLNVTDVQNKIGPEAWNRVLDIVSFLVGQPREDLDQTILSPRYASSIIMRTEAELFGVSSPRFGYRLYPNGRDNCAVVNIRRLQTLEDSINHRYEALRSALPILENPTAQARTAPARYTLTHQSCVADCLLSPPQRLPALFEDRGLTPGAFAFLAAPLLTKVYGETLPAQADTDIPTSTPYAMTVDISGGVCAQACCFMATALLHEYAAGVYGLAEITFLAHKRPPDRITIAGLSEINMMTYFSNVGLRTIPQQPKSLVEGTRVRALAQALASYAVSRIPVIATVDMSKLASFKPATFEWSFYEANGFLSNAAEAVPKHTKHAVLIVGADLDLKGFWISDPSAMPFMSILAEHFEDIGHDNKPGVYLPVTPREIHVPLLAEIDPEAPKNPAKTRGLMAWASVLDGASPDSYFKAYALPPVQPAEDAALEEVSPERGTMALHQAPDEKRFVLTQLGNLHSVDPRALKCFGGSVETKKALLEEMATHLMKTCLWHAELWIWLEASTRGMRIFHAQLPLFSCEELQRIVNEKDAAMLNFRMPVNVQAGNSKLQKNLNAPCLDLSVISSFSLTGLPNAIRSLPACVNHIELYAFMQEDLRHILPSAISGTTETLVVRALAEAHLSKERETLIREAADNIQSTIAEPRSVSSLCTFLPELMYEGDFNMLSETATSALYFLVDLAGELRKRSGRKAFTIEVVCGSRIDSAELYSNSLKGGTASLENVTTSILDPEKAIRSFLSRLKPVAERCLETPGVQLALELEPGPLFTLNSSDAVTTLCRILGQPEYEKVSRAIGINLDIAHWAFLTRIHPQWLDQLQTKPVRDRIAHAHICDQSNGHFADTYIGSFHNSEFDDWLRILTRLPHEARPASCPVFDGLISVEMEACRDIRQISHALEQLQVRLLQELSSRRGGSPQP